MKPRGLGELRTPSVGFPPEGGAFSGGTEIQPAQLTYLVADRV